VALHQDGLHRGVDCNAARAWKMKAAAAAGLDINL
jgi:hypothetical protein